LVTHGTDRMVQMGHVLASITEPSWWPAVSARPVSSARTWNSTSAVRPARCSAAVGWLHRHEWTDLGSGEGEEEHGRKSVWGGV